MQKRGATHADWAISLGLFLIYILSMFMILQPGVQPIYKEEQLIKNLKQEITDKTEFVLSQTPLIITTDDLAGAGTYEITIDAPLPFEKDGTKAAIFTEDGTYIDNARIDLTTNTLQFEASLELGSNKFWVYEIIEPNKLGDAFNYDNSFYSDATSIYNTKENFTYQFGAPETVEGLSWTLLNSEVLNDEGMSCKGEDAEEDYTILKNILNYPYNKDFIIQVIENPSPRYALEDSVDICHIEDPYEQASVFTEEWITYKVNKEGLGNPIRIHTVVW